MSLEKIFAYPPEERKLLRAEVATGDRVLNPLSTIKIRIYKGEELVYENETLARCSSFGGCFLCFTKDYTVITIEREGRKLSMPVSWSCLTWEGRPVIENSYFEEVKIGNFFFGTRGKYTYISKFNELEIYEGEDLFRIVLDSKKEFFTQSLKYEKEKE